MIGAVVITTNSTSPNTLTIPPRVTTQSSHLAVVDDPVSLNGVLKGTRSLARPSLGKCSVWGNSPSLWVPVARALGFEILSTYFGHAGFADFLPPFERITPVSYPARCKGLNKLAFVFCDWDTLPSLSQTSLWKSISVPFLIAGHRPAAVLPKGWSSKSLDFLHSAVGGATNGCFTVTLLAPEGFMCAPSTLPAVQQRPGGTIASSLDCRAPCHNHLAAAPAVITSSSRAVVRLPDGSFGSWGLFPANTPQCKVTVPTDFASSGFGIRALTHRELGDLWNVPERSVNTCQ